MLEFQEGHASAIARPADGSTPPPQKSSPGGQSFAEQAGWACHDMRKGPSPASSGPEVRLKLSQASQQLGRQANLEILVGRPGAGDKAGSYTLV